MIHCKIPEIFELHRMGTHPLVKQLSTLFHKSVLRLSAPPLETSSKKSCCSTLEFLLLSLFLDAMAEDIAVESLWPRQDEPMGNLQPKEVWKLKKRKEENGGGR
jgi:hypothetical protein